MLLFTPQPQPRTQFYRQPSLRSRCTFDPEPMNNSDFFSSYRPQPASYGFSPYSSYGYGYPSYAEIQAAKARRARELELEQYRRQLAARQAEAEWRRRGQLERERYLNALRAQAAAQSRAHGWYEEEEDEEMYTGPSYSPPRISVPISQGSPSPVPRTESQTRPASTTPTSPPPRVAPTLERQQEAASLIQSSFRSFLHRRRALERLASLRGSFNKLKESFIFPPEPSFELSSPTLSQPTSEQTTTKPIYKLSYNSTNAPIHAYEHALGTLLTELDGVESRGDGKVRSERKGFVRDVERVLEELDCLKEGKLAQFLRAEQFSGSEARGEVRAAGEEPVSTPTSSESEAILLETALADADADIDMQPTEDAHSEPPRSKALRVPISTPNGAPTPTYSSEQGQEEQDAHLPETLSEEDAAVHKIDPLDSLPSSSTSSSPSSPIIAPVEPAEFPAAAGPGTFEVVEPPAMDEDEVESWTDLADDVDVDVNPALIEKSGTESDDEPDLGSLFDSEVDGDVEMV